MRSAVESSIREFDTVLDSAARPGYTQLDRRHTQPDPAGALIDASRFDYEDSYDYEEVHCIVTNGKQY